MSVTLECEHVTFAYPDQPPLLEDVTIAFPGGSYSWLRGPSGCGNSTFLRLLGRLLEPCRGTISLQGRPLTAIDPPHLRRQVVYLHQTPVVLAATVRENLMLPFAWKVNQSLPKPAEAELTAQLAAFQLLGVFLETSATSLSVGQKQRLCPLRALLLKPAVLLLDEPVAALDEDSAAGVLAEVRRVHRDQGTTIIMVAHGEELLSQPGVTSLNFQDKTIVGPAG